MSKIYCITGNIGSGKTTVCKEFERLGIPVYYTDTAAKELMVSDPELVAGLKVAFGAETYFPDGSLNRKWLAEKAFGDSDSLKRLNGLVHPAVHRDADAWLAKQTSPYCLYETALVFEIDAVDRFEGIIVVAADEAIRRERVIQRDGTTVEAFAARAAKQWPDDKKEAGADFLIKNDGKTLLFPQVLKLHSKLCDRSSDASFNLA
jgi:dephospho-CoA kinase